ncbi:hypothetical protein ONZ45_g13160 [Pleurotus djamor]|nr:hypothetical protein ONZ45_g13160 [Pleurotus djamor]
MSALRATQSIPDITTMNDPEYSSPSSTPQPDELAGEHSPPIKVPPKSTKSISRPSRATGRSHPHRSQTSTGGTNITQPNYDKIKPRNVTQSVDSKGSRVAPDPARKRTIERTLEVQEVECPLDREPNRQRLPVVEVVIPSLEPQTQDKWKGLREAIRNNVFKTGLASKNLRTDQDGDWAEAPPTVDEQTLDEPPPPLFTGSQRQPQRVDEHMESSTPSVHHHNISSRSKHVPQQSPDPPLALPSPENRANCSHTGSSTPAPSLSFTRNPEAPSNSMPEPQLRRMVDVLTSLDSSTLTQFMEYISKNKAPQTGDSESASRGTAATQSISGETSSTHETLEPGLPQWWSDKAELAGCVRASINAKRERIKAQLLLRSSAAGLIFPPGQLPWHTLLFSLYENCVQMINLPDEVPFPGMESLKSSSRGVHGFPTQICTPWVRVLPKDVSLGAAFRKVSAEEAPLLQSGKIPIFISAPPHPLSKYNRGKQLYISSTRMWQDRGGPPKAPMSHLDDFGVYQAPYFVDEKVDSLLSRQAPKGVAHELGRSLEIRALIKRDGKSKRKRAKRMRARAESESCSEEGEDESDVPSEDPETGDEVATNVPRRSSRLHASSSRASEDDEDDIPRPPHKTSRSLRRAPMVSDEDEDEDEDERASRTSRKMPSSRSLGKRRQAASPSRAPLKRLHRHHTPPHPAKRRKFH